MQQQVIIWTVWYQSGKTHQKYSKTWTLKYCFTGEKCQTNRDLFIMNKSFEHSFWIPQYTIWCPLLHGHAALFIQNMFYCRSVLYSDNIASLDLSNWVKFPRGNLTLNFYRWLLLMHVVLIEFTIIAIKSCSMCISSFDSW